MERPKNLKKTIALTIVVLFHVVGFIGLSYPRSRAFFLQLVPYHLLLMATVIAVSHRGSYKTLLLFFLLIAIMGYSIEWIGVHTSLLFGSYGYGNTLGPKVSGIPVVIGINWFLLVYCTGAFMRRRHIHIAIVRIAVGALVLVLLDVLIESSAMRFNYWHWADSNVPIKNYLCWFIFSGIFLFIFDKFKFNRQSVIAEILLMMQFLFFAALLY